MTRFTSALQRQRRSAVDQPLIADELLRESNSVCIGTRDFFLTPFPAATLRSSAADAAGAIKRRPSGDRAAERSPLNLPERCSNRGVSSLLRAEFASGRKRGTAGRNLTATRDRQSILLSL